MRQMRWRSASSEKQMQQEQEQRPPLLRVQTPQVILACCHRLAESAVDAVTAGRSFAHTLPLPWPKPRQPRWNDATPRPRPRLRRALGLAGRVAPSSALPLCRCCEKCTHYNVRGRSPQMLTVA